MAKKEVKQEYSVSISYPGKEYKFKADTLFNAFGMIKPDIVKGKAILRVTKGKLKTERVLWPFELKRLMVSKFKKLVMEKQLNLLLK